MAKDTLELEQLLTDIEDCLTDISMFLSSDPTNEAQTLQDQVEATLSKIGQFTHGHP